MQSLGDGEAGSEALQRAVEVALASRTSPTRSWATERSRCQPDLSGSRLASSVRDRQALPIALEREVQLALSEEHVADAVVRDRQIALPGGVVRLGSTSAITSRCAAS